MTDVTADTRPAASGAAAIVVTHNSAAHAPGAVGALVCGGLAVHVVDNASADETAPMLAQDFPQISVQHSCGNIGFARAVNAALPRISSDVVLLVNPDCTVPPDTSAALVAALREDPTVGIAGPRICDEAGNVAVSAHPFESIISVVISRFGGSLIPVRVRRLASGSRRRASYTACLRGTDALDVDWISGACMAVRTDLLRSLGGLDEGYFLYYEDEELCLRTHQSGLRVVYLPHVQAEHVGGASASDPRLIWPHLYRSMLRYFARNVPNQYTAVRLAVMLRSVLGMGWATATLPIRRDSGRRVSAWWQILRNTAGTRRGDVPMNQAPPTLAAHSPLEAERCTS